MKQSNIKKRMWLFAVCISFIFSLFSGCVTTGGGVLFGWGDEPERKDHAHLKKHGGPPPHAPAHGYRSKYRYKYYPDTSVYFNSSKGLYFYLKGDTWTMSASLPYYLNVNLGSSVSIEMDTDKPYTKYKDHKKKYPSSKSKKKGKKNKY